MKGAHNLLGPSADLPRASIVHRLLFPAVPNGASNAHFPSDSFAAHERRPLTKHDLMGSMKAQRRKATFGRSCYICHLAQKLQTSYCNDYGPWKHARHQIEGGMKVQTLDVSTLNA